MKKTLLITLVIVMTFSLVALCGCGKKIEGSCSDVVSQCQSLKADEKATIVVTGRERYGMPGGTGMTFISDNGNAGEPYVAVYFDDKNTVLIGRVTITGELMPNMTDSDHISIRNAKVQK